MKRGIAIPFLLPFILVACLGLSQESFAQVVETQGENYDLVENFNIGEASWVSHPDRIMDGSWKNYVLTDTNEKVIFNSNAVGSFIFDKNSCSYSIYENGFDGEQVIPSVSAVATYLNNGQWQNLPINDEACMVEVSEYEDGVFLKSTKVITEDVTEDVFIDYTGTTENFYVNATNANFDLVQSSNGTNIGYYNGETITTTGIEVEKFVQELRLDINSGFKETFKVWHDGDESLGISQTVHTGESITIGDQTINIAELNGQSFDRQFIIDNEAEILAITDSVNYDFDTGIESLSNVNIIFDSTSTIPYKVNMDYADGGFVGYLEIDPTITWTQSGNFFSIASLSDIYSINSATIGARTLNSDELISLQNAIDTGSSTWEHPDDNNFVVTSGGTLSEVLVVAGGGAGGGGYGGGGGAGGLTYQTNHAVSAQTYPVTLGKGATGNLFGTSSYSYYSAVSGDSGGDSQFNTITTDGGGGGRNYYSYAQNGGSGGGGSVFSNGGGSGVSGQGNSGGAGSGGGGVTNWTAGGGGGAGSTGQTGTTSSSRTGHGGGGLSYSISGISQYYAGGGGGTASIESVAGLGGSSIGGNGHPDSSNHHATPNTGSGGGGGNISGMCDTGIVGGTPTDDSSSSYLTGCKVDGVTYSFASGAGSDGIVILRYQTGTITATGGTVTTDGSDTIHTFLYKDTTSPLIVNYNILVMADPPTNLSATDGLSIGLSWTAPNNFGSVNGVPVTSLDGYKVFRTLNEFAQVELPNSSGSDAQITFTDNELLIHGFPITDSSTNTISISGTGTVRTFGTIGTAIQDPNLTYSDADLPDNTDTLSVGGYVKLDSTPTNTKLLKLNDVTFNVGTTTASVDETVSTNPIVNDDFSSYTTQAEADAVWETPISRTSVDIGSDIIDVDFGQAYAGGSNNLPYLSGTECATCLTLSDSLDTDDTFKLRWKVSNVAVTNPPNWLFEWAMGLSEAKNWHTAQDAVGIKYRASVSGCGAPATGWYTFHADNTNALTCGSSPTDSSVSMGTSWIEIERTTPTDGTIKLFSTSDYTATPAQTYTVDFTGITNLNYINFGEWDYSGNGGGVRMDIDDVWLESSNGITVNSIISATGLSDNTSTPHHYAFTRDGNSWKIFQDGSQVGSTVTDTTSLGSNVGNNYSTKLSGTLDEFFINSDVLTATEIDNIYDRGVAPTLIASPTGTTYDDSSVTGGNTYYYSVQSVNAIGSSDYLTPFVSALAGVPPDPPTITGTSIASPNVAPLDIIIDWSSPLNTGTAGITNYEIYRDATLITTVGNVNTYTDTVPTGGGTFVYSLKSITSHGTSTLSGTASQTTATPPPAPTSAPTLDIANPNPSPLDVTVSFALPSSGGSAITSFEIFRSTDDITYTSVGTTSNLIFYDTVPNAGLYHYKFASTNLVGTGSQSPSSNITTANEPDAITDLATSAITDTTATLTWTAPNSNGSDIVDYTLYRDGVLISTSATTGFSDTGLITQTSYDYTVYARNNVGLSLISNSVTQVTDGVAGVVPLTATTAAMDQINLTWTEPNNYNSAITNYIIERESPTGGGFTTLITLGSVLSYSDGSLTAVTEYNYRITAVNGYGNGATSTSSAITLPAPPTNLTVNDCYHTCTTQLNLEWVAPVLSTGVNGYKITFETPVGGGFSTLVANTTTTTLYYNHTGLVSGQFYNYKVQTLTAVGESQVSNAYSYSPHKLPDSVDDLVVTTNSLLQFILNWSVPDNLYGTLSGYMINYTTPAGDPTTIYISDSGSPSTTSTISGFDPTVEHSFRVSAVTTHGTNATLGNISNGTITSEILIGSLTIDSSAVNPDVVPIWYVLSNVDANTDEVDVYFKPSSGAVDCTLTERNTGVETNYTSIAETVDGSNVFHTFTVTNAGNGVAIDFDCWDSTDLSINEQYALTQADASSAFGGFGNVPMFSLMANYTSGLYGTDGEFAGIDLITLFIVIVSMLFFNRTNPALGVGGMAMMLGVAWYFEVIPWTSGVLGGIAVVLVLALGQGLKNR